MGLEQSSESLTSLIGHNPGGERGPEGRERSARLVASGQSSWQAVGQATLGWEKADPRDPSGLSPCGPQDPQVTQTGCGSGATQRPLLHPLQPRPCLSPTRVHSAQGGTWGSLRDPDILRAAFLGYFREGWAGSRAVEGLARGHTASGRALCRDRGWGREGKGPFKC